MPEVIHFPRIMSKTSGQNRQVGKATNIWVYFCVTVKYVWLAASTQQSANRCKIWPCKLEKGLSND